jgi:hypothetical protein
MPCRCWPLNTLSHGRAMSPGSETGAPTVSPSVTPLSGMVTWIRDDSPSSMKTTPTVISASPLTASLAISPVCRSRTFGAGRFGEQDRGGRGVNAGHAHGISPSLRSPDI